MSNYAPIEIVSSYTGHIISPNQAQERIICNHQGPVASIIKLSVGPWNNNVYLVTCLVTHQALLIDAAAEAPRIIELINKTPYELTAIVTTHRHPDHWQALADVVAAFPVKTICGMYDAEGIDYPIDEVLEDADSFLLGNLVVEVIHLRGHTPGSIALCITIDGVTHIFAGDSLFPGGVGKTHSARDFAMLLSDVENRIFDRYLDNAIVYPGHGDDTTLGIERPALPLWKERGW